MEKRNLPEPLAIKELKSYTKGAEYSYTLGAFPTFELLKAKPGIAHRVLVHSSYHDEGKLKELG